MTAKKSALEERGLKIADLHSLAMKMRACDPGTMRNLNKDDIIKAQLVRLSYLERVVKLQKETIAELRGAE